MKSPTRKEKVRSATRSFLTYCAVFVCTFVALRGCKSFLRDQRDEYVASAAFQEANTIAKTASLKALEVTRIQDEGLGGFMAARMALLVGPEMPEPVYGENFLQKTKGTSRGVATAVSPDGYFLTAAHCLFDNKTGTRKDSLWVVGLTTTNRYLAQTDVIWLSEDRDLALIHARIKQAKWFTVADASPEIGSTVIGGGCVNGQGAGKLVSRTEEPSETPPLPRLKHNVPLTKGDSGGPLVDMSGHLIGINISIRTTLGAFEKPRLKWAFANVVTRAWLQTLIHDHKNQMKLEEEETPN